VMCSSAAGLIRGMAEGLDPLGAGNAEGPLRGPRVSEP
jgi:hypothetical protein